MCNNDFEWNVPMQENVVNNVAPCKTDDKLVLKLFLEGDEDSILNFLQEKAKGRYMPLILQELSEVLRNQTFDYSRYWSFIRLLISFDASLFMTTIYKSSVPALIPPVCDTSTLDIIVNKAFKAKDKLRYAIGIIGPVQKQLSYEHKQYILASCMEASSLDLLKYACDSLQLPPSIVVEFLRSKLDNEVALFTLYLYYHEAAIRGDVSENTFIEVFSYAYINKLLLDMKQAGGKSRDISHVIEYDIFKDSKCKNKPLYDLIKQKGHTGFSLYYSQKSQVEKVQKNIKAIVLYTKRYVFKPIGELPDYYILFNYETNLHALMPKVLCDSYNHLQLNAYIYQYDKNDNILYINQTPIPKDFINPPILKIGDLVEVSFFLRNGKLYPHARNLTKIFKVRVSNLYDVDNYKLRYKTVVRKRINNFCYLVEIIDLA
jgi:hypothetical protein